MRRRTDNRVRVALAVFALSAGLTAWALLRAVHVQGAVPPTAPAAFHLPPIRSRSVPPREYLALAVASAPFAHDRRAPADRFRMPDEAGAMEGERPPASGPTAEGDASMIRLTGTMLLPDGQTVALAQWATDPPRLLRPGESLRGFTLLAVAEGSATFAAPDGTETEVFIPEPGS